VQSMPLLILVALVTTLPAAAAQACSVDFDCPLNTVTDPCVYWCNPATKQCALPVPAGETCLASSTSACQCGGSHYCDSVTNKCLSDIANGGACSANIQCVSGYCSSGKCAPNDAAAGAAALLGIGLLGCILIPCGGCVCVCITIYCCCRQRQTVIVNTSTSTPASAPANYTGMVPINGSVPVGQHYVQM